MNHLKSTNLQDIKSLLYRQLYASAHYIQVFTMEKPKKGIRDKSGHCEKYNKHNAIKHENTQSKIK